MRKFRIAAGILALLCLLCLTGCVSVAFNYYGKDTLMVKGDLVDVAFDVPAYTAINVSEEFEIVYTNAESGTVTASVQEALRDHLKIYVENGTLYIDTDVGYVIQDGNIPAVHISTTSLERITVNGRCVIRSADTITGSSLQLNLAGSGRMTLDMDVDTLRISSSGASTLDLSGSAREAVYQVDGSATIRAFDLDTASTRITVNGHGNVETSCSDTLDVTINGSGNVQYKGEPNVTPNLNGMGVVTKAS